MCDVTHLQVIALVHVDDSCQLFASLNVQIRTKIQQLHNAIMIHFEVRGQERGNRAAHTAILGFTRHHVTAVQLCKLDGDPVADGLQRWLSAMNGFKGRNVFGAYDDALEPQIKEFFIAVA